MRAQVYLWNTKKISRKENFNTDNPMIICNQESK